jgi:SAM-dependent methyltransferase
MSSNYEHQLKEYYKRVVDVYDSSYTGIGRYRSNYFRLILLVYFLERLETRPNLILDAGCGDARPMIELINNGFNTRGFDISPDMLNAGKRLLSDAGHGPDLIREGSIYAIPEDDNSVDAVACMGVVENLPDHEQIFSEFRRVLKPGGHLVISLENDLFSLFSVNKYSLSFWGDLMQGAGVDTDVVADVIGKMATFNQVEDIAAIKKTFADAEIDKSSVQIDTYNPLNIKEKIELLGMEYIDLRYFHYHPIPPRFEVENPEVFQETAERLETTDHDWRGGILCNCMVVLARMPVEQS